MNWTLEDFPAAQVALLMVALQQMVLGLGWACAAPMMGAQRRGAAWSAAYALGTGLSIACFVAAIAFQNEVVRVLGNGVGVVSLIALHRAARAFIGRPPPDRAHALLMAVATALVLTFWILRQDPLRIAIVSAIIALLALWTARDAHDFARHELGRAWAMLIALPVLLTALVFTARSGRALSFIGQPMLDMAANDNTRVGLATVTMVAALATQVTLVALLVARQLLELRRSSLRDALTALHNRRAMEDLLAAEVQRARRLGVPFSVLVIDADHFKNINDRFGHAGGDRVLQHLAGVMSGTLRDIDRLGRWGGEEFVALLPATRVNDACVLAERLRERVAASPAPWGNGGVPITVSQGAAQWEEGEDAAAVLQRADAALYRAKRDGRNRVREAASSSKAIEGIVSNG